MDATGNNRWNSKLLQHRDIRKDNCLKFKGTIDGLFAEVTRYNGKKRCRRKEIKADDSD
ncbi:MAG: hypothetical protein L6420_04570 [Elusimicrobia bacterium]|nr:hypothetical protein [Elusimicrobiota bacterium]